MHRLILVILLLLALSACTSAVPPTNTPCKPTTCTTFVFAGTLRPYQTDTPTATITPPLVKSPTPTPTSTATPTAITYKVKDSDDMYGIAFRFGISPQALMTANPKVNPRAMGPGTILVIPVTLTPASAASAGTLAGPDPSPTAIVAIPRRPDCYPSTDGGVWCFLLVMNNQGTSLENITGVIRLTAPDVKGSQKPLEQTATTLLDLLPAGASSPLVAYFPSPVPTAFTPGGEVTLALPLPNNDARYLPATIQNQQVTVAADGKSAAVTGNLALSSSKTASQVWVAAAAFDVGGAVVGVRKWEAGSVLSSGSLLAFNFQVYTLGPLIDHVSLLVEARP